MMESFRRYHVKYFLYNHLCMSDNQRKCSPSLEIICAGAMMKLWFFMLFWQATQRNTWDCDLFSCMVCGFKHTSLNSLHTTDAGTSLSFIFNTKAHPERIHSQGKKKQSSRQRTVMRASYPCLNRFLLP